MADSIRWVGKKPDPKEYRKALRERIARKAREHSEDGAITRIGVTRLKRGYHTGEQ